MTIQYDIFGGAVNTASTEDKVERILREHPETRGLDKQLIVKLWLEEDGLLDILGDEALAERFERWFVEQATYTESITRVRRQLQSEGLYKPEEQHTARRNGRRQAFQERYRRN